MPLSTLQPSLVPATWLSPASPLSPPASTRAGAVVPGRWRRGWAGALALAASFAMVPWTAGLAARLPHRYVAHHWNATWVGFDTLLLLSFAVTGWTAWRHSQAATAATAVTITMLGCDAWFDLTTASTSADLVTSAVTAVAGELPLAAVLGYLVRRTVREPSPR
jgi:hypothetical protein